MSNKVHNQVKSSEIPKSIYVRHALMFIFSDIFLTMLGSSRRNCLSMGFSLHMN